MRSIDIEDGKIGSVLVADDFDPSRSGSLDVVVRLSDGRRFGLSLLTLEHLRRQLDQVLCVAAPGLLVVRNFSDEAITEAVRSSLRQGIERFGVLQPLIDQ
ncbi:MAG TPA: hypothetical protein VF794_30615 [Archangium sp.]|jgi:hypothetical protein|uniref:hypothetical protein n=1 Tax=Archangium sp. TaxID=1872627 RepID=UPI002ED8FF6A